MTTTISGFDYRRVPVADGVSLNAAVGGSGSPIVLLHGFPQTHLMWRHVAADLAADHTVICPDLRGYGASDKPEEDGPDTYSKRTMAADIVALARALGHERFALAGHDRGALVAFRAGLDHPDTITHLACLDVLPTLEMWDAMHGVSAAVGFHLDAVYTALFVRPVQAGASLVRFLDREVVDTYVRAAAAVPRLLGTAVRRAQTGNVQTYVSALLAGTVVLTVAVLLVATGA